MNRWTSMAGCALSAWASLAAPLVLVPGSGDVPAVIVVDGPVMEAGDRSAGLVNPALEAERQRIRLRDSVLDMAAVLRKMTGREVPVSTNGTPAGKTPILVGKRAEAVFGPVGVTAPFGQGLRVVVDASRGVGLYGESMLADSYAVYAFLDRLGCRWFMPGELGEVIPRRRELVVGESDLRDAPYTVYRGGSGYGYEEDGPFARRNRIGGIHPPSQHCLEGIVGKEELREHPEWVAEYEDGRPMAGRLKWSDKALAERIGEIIAARQRTRPVFCTCLSPDDGVTFDQSEGDRALDAGDFDPTFQTTSLTDRAVTFYNRIIERATRDAPGLLFSALAYVQYTRPPVRAKPHPNLIVYLAPITYSRVHPMDMAEPNNADLRRIVEGWGKACPSMAYYFYAYFLADPLCACPFLRKWAFDVPYVYGKGSCRYWMPESMANNEFFFMARWMALRMAWDPAQDPWKLYREANDGMYGPAAEPMWEFWNAVDECWTGTPEYSGAAWGHLRRFTPERIGRATRLLERAAKAAGGGVERERVRLAETSWRLTTGFVRLRRDLAEGNWSDLDTRSREWKEQVTRAAVAAGDHRCFAWCWWDRAKSFGVQYFDWFYGRTHASAQYVATNATILVDRPVREFRWRKAGGDAAPGPGPADPSYDDSSWPTTDVACRTWSSLGLHNHMGSVWYRAAIDVKKAPAGKRVWLWIGATDGSARVTVNGRPARGFPADGRKPSDAPAGYGVPLVFDVTDAIREGTNTVAILATRLGVNELGTGGILAPVTVYAEK